MVVAYDIYGFTGNRTRAICDELAQAGHLVVLPDFFRGERWTAQREAEEQVRQLQWVLITLSPLSGEQAAVDQGPQRARQHHRRLRKSGMAVSDARARVAPRRPVGLLLGRLRQLPACWTDISLTFDLER